MPTHGAFVCYAPVDNPQIAMVVFLDESSSAQASIIAGRILKKVFVPDETAGKNEQ